VSPSRSAMEVLRVPLHRVAPGGLPGIAGGYIRLLTRPVRAGIPGSAREFRMHSAVTLS